MNIHKLKIKTDNNKYETVVVSNSFEDINRISEDYTSKGINTIIEFDSIFKEDLEDHKVQWIELIALFLIASFIIMIF